MNEDLIIAIGWIAICGAFCLLLIAGVIG